MVDKADKFPSLQVYNYLWHLHSKVNHNELSIIRSETFVCQNGIVHCERLLSWLLGIVEHLWLTNSPYFTVRIEHIQYQLVCVGILIDYRTLHFRIIEVCWHYLVKHIITTRSVICLYLGQIETKIKKKCTSLVILGFTANILPQSPVCGHDIKVLVDIQKDD